MSYYTLWLNPAHNVWLPHAKTAWIGSLKNQLAAFPRKAFHSSNFTFSSTIKMDGGFHTLFLLTQPWTLHFPEPYSFFPQLTFLAIWFQPLSPSLPSFHGLETLWRWLDSDDSNMAKGINSQLRSWFKGRADRFVPGVDGRSESNDFSGDSCQVLTSREDWCVRKGQAWVYTPKRYGLCRSNGDYLLGRQVKICNVPSRCLYFTGLLNFATIND